MHHQPDLFSSEIKDTSRHTSGNSANALRMMAQHDHLSPGQQRFNRLLDRIEKLKVQWVEMQMMCDAHRPVYHQILTPLRERHSLCVREMVFLLDSRLQRRGLSAQQERIAAAILCNLSMQLIVQGDEEMKALHDKYSSESLSQKEQSAMMDMREMMEDMLGGPLTDDESLETVNDVFEAGMKRLREAEEVKREARQARIRKRKPSAAQLQAEANQKAAETTLRKVFRQLASALHPDRASDSDERDRKTVLMSEANAAYDRRDLVALLQIQLRVELTDTASIAKMADEQIAAMTLLLKQQAQELESGLQQQRHEVRYEFGLKSYETVSVANLNRSLRAEESFFERELSAMQQDLQQLTDDKYFKRWLKDQKQLSKEPRADIFDDWRY
ncbi:hypothetical protein SAMN06296273_2340 [Nitrosomonas ureae]|uniref:DnaJ domain-containing protein n=1 Tax=Nitrosomonas ureae TaxID=44577 RepID=A0A285C0N9_9PROT|nr:hypothetical protein [Nitrosomonas ureae]SNX60875.1 hypothetical protein SAMN06296273_2340 [Nitrosomonas ureae]